MKPLAYLACLVLVVSLVVLGCSKSAPAPATPNPAPDVIEQKTCPVMTGTVINPKIFVDYKGRRIYFCCNDCPGKFKENPEKYVKIVDEQINEERLKAARKTQ